MKMKKSKRTTIFLNENKLNFIKEIKKTKGLNSTTKVLEYLMDNYQNRLSNHIAKNTENILIMFYLQAAKKEINKENIKNIFDKVKKIENVKNEVLKELEEEKRKKQIEDFKEKINEKKKDE
jgi:activator of 2-hydroxyglutaryl-CoA dehydratase